MAQPTKHSDVQVGELIDLGRWSGFQKVIVALVALALVVDGLANQVLGLAMPALIDAWRLPRADFAPVAALGLAGVTIGTLLGGMLGDRFGRRLGLIVCVLAFGIASIAAANTNGISALMVARFLDGLGLGGAIPNAAALSAEFTPARRRSIAVAMTMVCIPVGGLLAGLVAIPLLPAWGWRSIFVAAGAPSILLAGVFWLLLPESPRFLARKGRSSELSLALNRCGLTWSPTARLVDSSAANAVPRLRALFERGLFSSTVGLWLAFFFCLLASYTIFSWVPTLLTGQGYSQARASLAMTYFNLGGVVGGIAGGWLISRLGSQRVTMALAAGAALGAAALAVVPLSPQQPFAGLLIIMLVEGFFISGLHAGLYTVAAHIYEPLVRATGVGAASAAGRIGAILSSFTGVLTMQFGGRTGYFLVISGAATLSLLSLFWVRHHIQRANR
jgi:AAHS family 4-hydroxybenzoate transporter-like MFS transporter